MDAPAILWFRRDLRLTDNPALAAAVASGAPLVPVFVWDEQEGGEHRLGGASRWWLHMSLLALGEELGRLGVPLILRRGPARAALLRLVEETGASRIFFGRLHEPAASRRDAEIEAALRARGVTTAVSGGDLLVEPADVRSATGEPFRVFTPFWRACLATLAPAEPRPAPKRLRVAAAPASDRLEDWGLTPTRPDWAGGLRESWRPGERGALRRLDAFLAENAEGYPRLRDFPAREATSRLSPHLHWGEIGPRQVFHAVRAAAIRKEGADAFLRQLGWREFCHHLLAARPSLPEEPLDEAFARFPWTEDRAAFAAWTKGRTGYPIVDAGMRQLWRTGFMHNRLRMVVASFLVKDLLIPWQEGERWFWDTLVDADLANNAANWQWVAGCGADAAPYFRVFNPVLQSEKFDPDGDFVRRFVPEIAGLPAKFVHRPWDAPAPVLREAGVRLGETYPRPIVDHAAARERALAAFATIRKPKLAKPRRSR